MPIITTSTTCTSSCQENSKYNRCKCKKANSVVFDIVTAKGNVLNNVFPVVVVEKTMFLKRRVVILFL